MPEFSGIRRLCAPAQILAGLVGLLLLVAATARAQTSTGQSPPAYIRIVNGTVLLDRQVETESADVGMPFVPGDRLRSTRGRAEVLFPDGTALDLDEFTEVSLQSDRALRLESGRVWVAVPLESNSQLQIDTPAATTYSDGAGEFRVALLGVREPQTEVVVARGRAELVGDRGSVKLVGGERSVALANDVPSRPEQFDARRRLEPFDEWAFALREERSSGRSAQYLPPDLRVYGSTLDQSGSWQYDNSYGYIWYPTVDTTWRPYYSGYWATVPAYGWTWIGYERWAWPTHHYGRWGHANKGWFWIPERHWGSAWVSWGAAPGYVSWCPLGFDNRPVSGWSVSAGTAWGGGWVVLPRERFGIGHEHVSHYAVAPHSLPRQTPFVMQSTPPVSPPQSAVRRISQPGAPPATGAPPPREANQQFPRSDRPRNPGYSAASQNAADPMRRTGAVRQRSPDLPTPSASVPASGSNGIRPRVPSRSQLPASVTGADSRPAPNPGSYPFGDFRRRGAVPSSQGDLSDSASAASPRAIPRPRGPGAVGTGPAIQPQRETPTYQPAPAIRGGAIPRRSEPEGQAPAPQSRPYSAGRSERAEGGSTGPVAGAPRQGAGGGAVGRAVPRGPQPDGGGGAAASRGGDAGQGGDGHSRQARPR